MKHKLVLLFLLICILNVCKLTAQGITVPRDSIYNIICGTTIEKVRAKQQSYLNFIENPSYPAFISQSSFPINLIETCGSFRIYYEDLTLTPALGFADPTLGSDRRNTFCAVLNYIEGIIDIPTGVTIDIFVPQSLTSSNPSPANTAWLANAGPYFPPGGFETTAGFYAGNVYNHISTGTDPDVNNYDANVQVNFDQIKTTYSLFTIPWWNDYQNTSQTCAYDLYSVLLHEMTHSMGWISSIGESTNTNHDAICKVANNGFTRFDNLFLYYTNDISTLSFTKVVSTSSIAINPAVNTFTIPLRKSNIWLYNNGAPLNQPVYSGDYRSAYDPNPAPFSPGSLMSHLNDAYFSFLYRAQYSPGYQPGYVMAPSMDREMLKREWTLPELRVLNQFGYTFNYPFNSTQSVSGVVTATTISNSPPYRTNYNQVTAEVGMDPVFSDKGASNFTITTNNNTPSTPSITQLVINLSSDANISDGQSNPISVFPGSLFNIRGCGIGGNNHNCLTLSNNNRTITYTPRPGYKGRAIFGFYMTDGIERGAFKVYSIDVQNINTTYLNSITTMGNNLIMNPGFEEGTEFKLRSIDEGIENFRSQFYREGTYLCGTALADNHFDNYDAAAYNVAGGSFIGNSWKECNHTVNAGTLGNYGQSVTDFNSDGYTSSIWLPNPISSTTTVNNKRYTNLIGLLCYSELLTPIQSCHRYRFSAEVNFQQTSLSIGSIYTYTLNFVQPPTVTNFYPTTILSVPVSATVTAIGANQWQTITTDFNYCGSSSSFLKILGDQSYQAPQACPKIDNLSLIEISPVGTFSLAVTNSNPQYCSSGCSVLSASLTSPFCSPSYTWMPGASNSASVNVCPSSTTVYTLTASDGCTTRSVTTTVTVNPLPTLTISPTSTVICTGNSVTLTASGANTYTWAPGSSTVNPLVVSPTVTTNYTVTGTNTITGCTNTKTVSVTVNTTPTVAVNSPTICSGQTTTLTASGANTYSWNTTATTASISVSPTTTTNYTVVGTLNGCSSIKTSTVTVKISPTLTVIASPTSICSGQSSTLSVSGASTYSWSTGVSTSSITVSPTVTTIYTVTGTNTISCSSSKTVSLIVGAYTPTITISTTSISVCGAGSATLSAGGASSYTWMPGSIMIPTTAVSPSVATIYTVSGTYGTGCGISTATTLVNPVISTLCCTAPSTVIGTSLTSSVNFAAGNYTVSGTIIDMQGTVTIIGTTSFTGYTFRMAPNTLLKVIPSVTLTLTNCKLFSCSELWNGIMLQGEWGNNSALNLNNTSIEDMYNGIVLDYGTAPFSTTGSKGTINITNSILNKNYIAIQIKNSTGSAGHATSYPFSITTSTLSSYASTTSPGADLKPSSTYTYAYKQITNGSGNTSAPYLNFPRSFIGISLENLGNGIPVTIGNYTSTALTNIFDNLDFGIYGTEVKTIIQNNYFKNITGSVKSVDPLQFGGAPPADGPDEIGIAIAITQTATPYNNGCRIGKNEGLPSNNNPFPSSNKFEDCNKGARIINCSDFMCGSNVFTTTTTSIPVSTTSGWPPSLIINPNTYYFYKGQSAIWSVGVGQYAEIASNIIRNHNTGIYNNHSITSSGSGQVSITDNDIAAPSSTGYCKQAIQVAQVGGYNLPTNGLSIVNNTIDQVYCGIVANSVLDGLWIQNPHIFVEDVAKTVNYSATQQRTGIILNNCEYALVKGNVLSSNASSIPTTSTTSNYLNGVYLTNSKLGKIECNSTTNLGRCFVFQGTCDNSWKVNNMSNSYTGLEIRTLGRIGPQGAASGAPNLSANTWTTITRETNIISSAGNNTISPLYVASGAGTQPTLNFGTSGHTYTVGPSFGIRVVTGTSYTCNEGSAERMTEGDNTGVNYQQKVNQSADSLANYISLAKSDENTYDVFTDEFIYQNKQLVYKLLNRSDIQSAEGSSLANFYDAYQNTAISKLTEVQEAISNNSVNDAINKNTSVSVSNQAEYKHQRANELMLKYLNNRMYTYTSDEKRDIYDMANECIVKGYYVVQTRNLLNIITHQITEYEDLCEAEANAMRRTKGKTEETENNIHTSFNLFPNPNNGNMVLDYDLGTINNAVIKLYDITGKFIKSYKLDTGKGMLEMNEQNLHNGIYFYHILVEGKTIKADKIVIIK